jgi:hypothetical protein
MIDIYPRGDVTGIIKKLATLDDDQLVSWMWRYPGVIQEMFKTISVHFEVFDNLDAKRMGVGLSIPSKRKLWRGLWLGNIINDAKLLVISTLCPGPLTQEILNFLTLADVSGANYQMVKAYDPSGLYETQDHRTATLDEYHIDEESRNLAGAFVSQMVTEAVPYREHSVLGHFLMDRVPLKRLDSLIQYDTLRLSISPHGIFGSLVKGSNFLTFWWSPEVSTTWSLGAKHAWAVNTMMACIWRDACVVHHKMFQQRSRSPYKPAAKKQKRVNKKLVLPRIIRKCAWSQDAERQRITHAEHSVRAFYRQLPAGHQVSCKAEKTAAEFGYPLPPAGFTFVRPHIRRNGEGGDTVAATPVVCLGLQVAHLALSESVA